ncbi:MAG TPA: hypothetical protein VK610_07030, partial [Rhodothermales bacterium]|nr:hypothetical protein [Rhodothermales bacterium]
MRLLLLLVLAALLAPAAHAQTCTTSWTNAAGGPWATAGNWDNGVPDAADDVCITLAGTYTVTVGAFSVNSLTVGGASGVQTLQLSGNFSLAATGSVGANGALLWRGGYLEAGTLTNAGTVQVASVTSNSRGVSGAAAVFRNAGTGTVTHSDAGLFYVWNGGRAENAGTWTFSGDGDLSGSSGAGTFVNEAGATLRKTGGTATVFTSGSLTVENSGTINATGGELRFDRPSSHTAATLTTGVGGTLRFNTDIPTFTGAITGAQGGALVLSTNFVAGAGASWAFTGNGLTWTAGYLTSGTLTNTGLVQIAGLTDNS